jgi:hypothetical protein
MILKYLRRIYNNKGNFMSNIKPKTTRLSDFQDDQSDIDVCYTTESLPTGTLNVGHLEGKTITEIAGFASRYNNKRHFLIASKLLGKYIPARPSAISEAQKELASLYIPINHKTLFIGFAESCSGFGNGVFESTLDKNMQLIDKSAYIHTTRQFKDGHHDVSIAFKEEHSHAVNQVIMRPQDETIKDVFESAETIVLIEDEITTGKTIKNLLNEYLSQVNNKIKRVVILTILDVRTLSDKVQLIQSFPNIQIITHSLSNTSLRFYKEHDNDLFIPKNKYIGNAISIPLNTGRQGVMYRNENVSKQVSEIMLIIDKSTPITVIGTSEFTHWPKLFAEELEKNGYDVLMSSTSRAPLKVGNDIKTKLTFPDHYGEGIEHYLYNLDADRKSIFCYENEEQLNIHTFLHSALNAIAVKRNDK